MSGKYALIIANTEYTDSGLAQLTAPGRDADDFARVLREKDLCAFDDVKVLLNEHSNTINEAIDEFFDQKKPDDLLLLYFSGHGVRDELGALYLAVKNTNRYRLRVSAVKSDFIKESMDQSRSRRQVLILDCCNSGAFSQGTKAATGVSIGTATAFEGGFGRVILTASDSTQFAWEGDKIIGDTDNSLFTHFLVEGLEGKADRDGDGHITVDELYDYAYEKVRLATPKQTPSKFSTRQQGEIVLRQNIRIEDIKAIPLPDDLIAASRSSLTYVREAAVRQLDELLKNKNRGLARSARELLEQIAENDDSKIISRTAFQALESIRQAEDAILHEEESPKIIAKQKETARQLVNQQNVEAERLENEKAEKYAAHLAEEERIAKAKLEADRLKEVKRRADEKAQVENKKIEMTSISIPSQDIETPFYLRWYGRILTGGSIGLINMLPYIIKNSYDTTGAIIIVLAGCLAGLIFYPRKLSLIFLVVGFLVLGSIGSYDNIVVFWAWGSAFGLPTGALLSRILYWVKIIK